MPYYHLRKYEALERIDFVSTYKHPELNHSFRLNICKSSDGFEDKEKYEQFLRLVNLCRVTYPDWKIPEIRLAHLERPPGVFESGDPKTVHFGPSVRGTIFCFSSDRHRGWGYGCSINGRLISLPSFPACHLNFGLRYGNCLFTDRPQGVWRYKYVSTS
jgi:hypothetical protein